MRRVLKWTGEIEKRHTPHFFEFCRCVPVQPVFFDFHVIDRFFHPSFQHPPFIYSSCLPAFLPSFLPSDKNINILANSIVIS